MACSFFQSWAWVGCLAAERFDDPVLVEVQRDGVLAALALFNRRRRNWLDRNRLYLSETGCPKWDAVFIEHNGFLVAADDDEALQRCLSAALDTGRGSTVVLSGIGALPMQAADAMGAACIARQIRLAPRVDLAAIVAAGGRHLDQLSANTRYQLRRSARRYTEAGPLVVTRAASPAQAHTFLEALAVLHQATWTDRGHPGAFANPDFVRFHHALIDRCDAVDLLRVTAGDQVVGYLHNFCFRGGVSAYQSGFEYAGASAHAKPGLTCHHLAIERYGAEGMAVYDFLAGDDRYKTSLATAAVPLHWVTLAPRWSLPGVAGRLKARLRRIVGRN